MGIPQVCQLRITVLSGQQAFSCLPVIAAVGSLSCHCRVLSNIPLVLCHWLPMSIHCRFLSNWLLYMSLVANVGSLSFLERQASGASCQCRLTVIC